MSHCKITQEFEWCTELPLVNLPRESPTFLLNGNEWFFRFLRRNVDSFMYYEVYLELKKRHRELKPCSVSLQVGFKNEKTFVFGEKKFTTSVHLAVWDIFVKTLNSYLPSDYCDGNWIKFVFRFYGVIEPLFKDIKKTNDKSVQTPSYIDSRSISENIAQDFSKLFDEGQNYDVEFICGGQTIKAHKIVLSCRSDVFASMFHSDMIEGKTGRVNIKDMDAILFKQFLKFLYTGMLSQLTIDKAVQFYEISDKYNVSTLKKHCADYLADNLCAENMCDILILADRHNDFDFKEIVVQYIKGHKTP